MNYYTGLTKAQADGLSNSLLNASRAQLNTVATSWGQVQLKDGTWAVKDDPTRRALLTLPTSAKNRIAEVTAANRYLTDAQAASNLPPKVADPTVPKPPARK
jgi:hypothetical protein